MTKVTYNRKSVENFLKEHIIRGDKGDGIPNFLSEDDVFVTGTRQSRIMEVKLLKWLDQEPEEFCDADSLRRYKQNQALVDLTMIPEEIEQAILGAYAVETKGSRNKIYPYLVKNRMKNLLDCVHEF